MSDKVEMIFLSRCFLKKMNKRIRLYYYETSGRLVFVCFLEEIERHHKDISKSTGLQPKPI